MAVVALRSQISPVHSFHVILQEFPGHRQEVACTAQGEGDEGSHQSSDGEMVSPEEEGINNPSCPLGHKATDRFILQQERPG